MLASLPVPPYPVPTAPPGSWEPYAWGGRKGKRRRKLELVPRASVFPISDGWGAVRPAGLVIQCAVMTGGPLSPLVRNTGVPRGSWTVGRECW